MSKAMGAYARRLRQQQGLSVRAMADKAGVSHGTISNLEIGKVQPDTPTLRMVAQALGVPVETLLSFGDARDGGVGPVDLESDPRLRRPPVVFRMDQRAPASDSWPMAEEYPVETSRAHLWEIDVRGDCMARDIQDGDAVWVDPTLTAAVGDVVVVYWQGDWTLKRLRRRNGKWLLVPDNPEYEPLEVESSQLRVLGVVVRVLKGRPSGTRRGTGG